MTTRRKATQKLEVDDRPEGDQEFIQFAEPLRPNNGCMIPIMFAMMIGMFGFLIWDRTQASVVAPVAPVVTPVGPVVDLTAYMIPLRTKLSVDPAKAAVVADVYKGFADAMAGPSGARVTDSRVFEMVSRAVLIDLQTSGGVVVGEEIDAAIGSYLGMRRSTDPKEPGWDPMTFDTTHRAKLIEMLRAISTTAEALK